MEKMPKQMELLWELCTSEERKRRTMEEERGGCSDSWCSLSPGNCPDTITLVEQLCMGIQGSLQFSMWEVGLQMCEHFE